MNNTISPEFKICPNCKKKFTLEEYKKEKDFHESDKQIEGWWKRKAYCSYDCRDEFHSKILHEKQQSAPIQHQFKFNAPIEILTIKDGIITEIKVLLYNEWKTCEVKNE